MAREQPRPARKLHTVPQTADLLECSEAHVYRLIASGDLAVTDISLPGSRRSKTRIPDDSVTAYIDAKTRSVRGVSPAPSPAA
jgi:Helix-turn-helix domain